jgi:spermidine/putrescine transport system permease protein
MRKNRCTTENRTNGKMADIADLFMSAPILAWTILFIVAAIVLLFVMSFMTKGPLGIIQYKFTLKNYQMIFKPVYFKVIKQSLVIAFFSTVCTILVGYPLAYYIARKSPKVSGALILLMVIPFWANDLVIIYGFVILFNANGIINNLLLHLGLIKEPLQMLYTNFSVVVGMMYMLLPFAVMPMYSSIEKLDYSLIEASKDLGANPVNTFLTVTLPLTSPGIFAAVILVFIPSIGYYMVTDMLGGGTSMMVGNLIYNQFSISRNWPFGAALSVLLAGLIFIMLFIYNRIGGDMEDLAL